MLKKYLFISSFLLVSATQAMQPYPFSVLSPNQCKKVRGIHEPFILVIKKGDELNKKINECMKAAKIPSASLSGLGGILNPKLGYYNLNKHQYQWRVIKGEFELLSLIGNVTKDQKGEYKDHIHVTLGGEHYNTIGGHLKNAIVNVTAEITVIPFEKDVTRKFDSSIKLPLIQTDNRG